MNSVFVPARDSQETPRLLARLGVQSAPIVVRVAPESRARPRNCYVNVQDRISRDGGRMLQGWAIWQHDGLFIEAESHAVYDPCNGAGLLDLTPHQMPDGAFCSAILFVPNEDAPPYDHESTIVPDNIRLALTDDPRVLEALKLFSEKTALMNSVPIIDGPLPLDVSTKIRRLDSRIFSLLHRSPISHSPHVTKIGRNDPCPCGSGKKFKKCHLLLQE